MNSFSAQYKDTLHDIKGLSSKIIPVTGTFLGKSVTVISANPLATAAFVAAVIVVSLLIFAAYKHYQNHQQLKVDNASLRNLLCTATLNAELVVIDLKKENKKITALVKEKEILENENRDLANLSAILKNEKEYYKNEKEILENESNSLINELKESNVNFVIEINSLEDKMLQNDKAALTEQERLMDLITSLKAKK